MHQYDIQAWVTISQDYSIPSILSQLLASLKGKPDPVGRDSSVVIDAEKLEIFKILWGRRYLIVIDDIWSVEAWDHVQRLFPDNNRYYQCYYIVIVVIFCPFSFWPYMYNCIPITL